MTSFTPSDPSDARTHQTPGAGPQTLKADFEPMVQALLMVPSTSAAHLNQLRTALALTTRIQTLLSTNAARKKAFDHVRSAHRTRLAFTHQKPLNDPQTAPLCTFFFDQLYPISPPSWRTAQLERALPSISTFMPPVAQRAICAALVLEALCTLSDLQSIDASVLPITIAPTQSFHPAHPLQDPFWSLYLPVYTSTQQPLRLYQLRRLHALTQDLLECANSFMIQGTLRMMRTPARALGVEPLHSFLEHGMALLRSAPNPKAFVEAIVASEQQLCAHLFSVPQARYCFGTAASQGT